MSDRTHHRIVTRQCHAGQVLRLTLDAPPGNILDREMMGELTQEIRASSDNSDLKAIVFDGRGDHFSYGASIQEHRREEVEGMLASFRRLFESLIDRSLPLAAIVRGQCLGGGLELASFCPWVFAQTKAILGQPEIRLSVFAPFASLILPSRLGQAHADDLLLTGRTISAQESLEMGLVTDIASDPERSFEEFAEKWILPKSAVGLRHGFRASRIRFHKQFLEDLGELEDQYVQELMASRDANEGIESFLAKRPPEWENQ